MTDAGVSIDPQFMASASGRRVGSMSDQPMMIKEPPAADPFPHTAPASISP